MDRNGEEIRPDARPGAVSGSNGEGTRQINCRYYPVVDTYAFQAGCIAGVDGILDEQGPSVKPGARELLKYFRGQGIKTAVASSSGRERVRSNLRMTELNHFFNAVVSGRRWSRGKPEPDLVLPPKGMAVSKVCASLLEAKALIEAGVL